jgi:hypothetical protein
MDNIINFSNNHTNNSYILNSSSNQIPIYKTNLSTSSNWSHISNSSSGFESQPESIDFNQDVDIDQTNSFSIYKPGHNVSEIFVFHNQQQHNENNNANQLFDNSMESDIFGNDFNTLISNNSNEIIDVYFTNNNIDNYVTPTNDGGTNFNNIQMWQFLLELLEDKRCRNLIRWSTSSIMSFNRSSNMSFDSDSVDNEFIIIDPIEIARRWSIRGSKSNMTYRKFNRILRYYCKKKILQKTAGRKNQYHFLNDIQSYLNQIHMQQYQNEQMLYYSNQMEAVI